MGKKPTSRKALQRPTPPAKGEKDVAAKVKATTKATGKKSVMSKSELDEFRKMLMEKRRALLGDMSGIEAEAFRTNRQDRSGDLSNIPIHPADIGSDNYEQEFTLGLLESERTLLTEINEALERMEDGAFGICLGTGKPIDKARLRARPWAKYCIEYARMLEKGLVQPQDGTQDQEEQVEEEDTGSVDEEPVVEEEEPVEEEPEE